MLEFLQDRFSAGLTPSTLRVYVAAIAAFHAPLDVGPLGRHQLVVRFLRGAWRMRPATRSRVPTWDLAVVLEGLSLAPFEPLELATTKNLTFKMVFLLAITSLKRVGDLQALAISPTCLEFAPGGVKAILHPKPGYVPKVPFNVARPVVLQAFHPPPHVSAEEERLRHERLYVMTQHQSGLEWFHSCFRRATLRGIPQSVVTDAVSRSLLGEQGLQS